MSSSTRLLMSVPSKSPSPFFSPHAHNIPAPSPVFLTIVLFCALFLLSPAVADSSDLKPNSGKCVSVCEHGSVCLCAGGQVGMGLLYAYSTDCCVLYMILVICKSAIILTLAAKLNKGTCMDYFFFGTNC